MASTKLYGPATSPQTAGGIVPMNTPGGIAAALPAKQSVLGTAETVILNPSVLAQALLCAIPPNSPLEQKRFRISASGYVQTSQSSTVAFGLRLGTSIVAASDTSVCSSGASSAIATTTVPFSFDVDAIYDSVSGKLSGFFTLMIGSQLIGPTAFAAVAASLNNAGGAQGAAVANFVLTVTFGTGATANVVNLQGWEIQF